VVNYGVEKDVAGVYLLMGGDSVLYVGQSRNVSMRVNQHRRDGRIPFDSVRVVKCGPENLIKIESDLIFEHRPKFNNCGMKKYSEKEAARKELEAKRPKSKKLMVTPELIKHLEARGYEIKAVRKLTRKTFVIDDDALALFLEVRKQSGLSMQDAASEALKDWAEKRRK
jgi:hypothetical protein